MEIVSQDSWMTEGRPWPFLPVIQSNTNLSSAVKGFCRCKSIGSKLIKREIVLCGLNLIRSSLKQDFRTFLSSETSNSSRAQNFSSLRLHLPSSLTAVNNLQLVPLGSQAAPDFPFLLACLYTLHLISQPPHYCISLFLEINSYISPTGFVSLIEPRCTYKIMSN